MFRAPLKVLALACLALALPFGVYAQAPPPPTVFTYVAEWDVSRDKWAEAGTFMEKGIRPAMERLVADGTLVDFGIYETYVHQVDGFSHGIWWSATSFASIEKARTEALKVPPVAALTSARHQDYLLRSLVGKNRPGAGTGGFLRVVQSSVQPGKGAKWRELWDKYNKPVYDALVADGTLSFYAVQVQQVATQSPAIRMVVSVATNAEAMDKAYAAFTAASAKRSAEENTAISAAFADTLVADAGRSYVARVGAYSVK